MTPSHPWVNSSDVLSIFPTFIWKFELASEARAAVDTKLRQALERLRPSRDRITPAQGWQTHSELHTLDELSELVSCINDAVKTISQFLKIGYDAYEITGCWANLNPPGAPHKIHTHPNNFLSGVYYVHTPAGADTINFHDPRAQTSIIRPPVTELTAANTDQVVVKVSAGTLLIFPAYLPHSVDPNDSGEERISISFNIMFSSFTENLSKPLW